MKKYCQNPQCQSFKKSDSIVKFGKYHRAGDSRKIQRFRCTTCLKSFSSSTGKLEFNQKERRKNPMIFKLLASGVSMRRIAKVLSINRKTVVRRLKYFGEKSRKTNKEFRKKLKVDHLQIDDLITKENSKLKPLSVSIAVDGDNRFILDAQVSEIRAFGHLAKKGKRKYPGRKNKHKYGLYKLFEEIKDTVDPQALIRSDEHKAYPIFVKKYFPKATHQTFKGERGCVAGQGELKKVRRDPLFTINHTCAMMRANINRMIRKTWCTTKDPLRLKDHIDLFIYFYNTKVLKFPKSSQHYQVPV